MEQETVKIVGARAVKPGEAGTDWYLQIVEHDPDRYRAQFQTDGEAWNESGPLPVISEPLKTWVMGIMPADRGDMMFDLEEKLRGIPQRLTRADVERLRALYPKLEAE